MIITSLFKACQEKIKVNEFIPLTMKFTFIIITISIIQLKIGINWNSAIY